MSALIPWLIFLAWLIAAVAVIRFLRKNSDALERENDDGEYHYPHHRLHSFRPTVPPPNSRVREK